jgi:repressor LexA
MIDKIDNNLILNKIKFHFDIKKDKELAEKLEIKQSLLANWRARNTLDYRILIDKINGLSANWLLTGEGEMFLSPETNTDFINEPGSIYHTKHGIPLIPIEAVAGAAKGDVTALSVDSENYFIPDFNNKADFLIRVSGNSMAPKYYNGDIVACKQIPTATFIQWGKVYVLDTLQGAICKRLFEGSKKDTIKVVSENANYPPFEISLKTDVRSISIVVGVIRVE